MKQTVHDILAVAFTCPTTIAEGDVAVIDDDNEIIKNEVAGSLGVVGNVATHRENATTCVVNTKFRERRDDRLAGAACAVGPFVWDADMKAIEYDANTHDSAAIAGLVIKSAAQGDDVVETLEY